MTNDQSHESFRFDPKSQGGDLQMKMIPKDYAEMNMIEKRIGYLVGARLPEVDKIKMAMQKQDEIRERHPAHEGWDSASVIRKWREAR